MTIANIATTKNQLSRLLRRVRRGETILITDRNHPVAKLAPVGDADPDLVGLHASGLLRPPQGIPLDLAAFLSEPRPRLTAGADLASAVLEEREESR